MREKCFVIMPFSKSAPKRGKNYWDQFFIKIKEIFDELGYDVFRSDDKPQSLTESILHDLSMSDLVFAVLTDRNPNVYYELGVRNSQRRGTIMAIQKGQSLPFDLNDYGIINYSISTPRGIKKLKDDIEKYIRTIKEREESKDSPVSAFLNIDHQNAYNIACSRLRETMILIRNSFDEGKNKEEIKKGVKSFQKSLGRNVNGQIAVIEGNTIIIHETERFEGQSFEQRWVERGVSIIYELLPKRKGIKIAHLDLHHDRVSIIAFDYFNELQWLVVAEGHYYQQLNPKPY